MFTPETFAFLRDLRDHNSKEWFDANRDRYERQAKAPLLEFVGAMRPYLEQISRHFVGDQRSVFRIHRDVRFSHDKSPYKTHLAAQFRHGMTGGPLSDAVHAPGFYFNLAPDGHGEMEGVFGGFGMWQPPTDALYAIRTRIIEHPDDWQAAVRGIELRGSSLKRPPAGFAADHPRIDDLKRKDFIAIANFSEADAIQPDFVAKFAAAMAHGAPLQKFLCQAMQLPF
jgi:uncharacterized protein (TIGR02453 family)